MDSEAKNGGTGREMQAEPMLNSLDMAEEVRAAQTRRKKKSSRWKVLSLVICVCILTVILGCIFGLKPSCSREVNSCKNRCFERKFGSCRCDTACVALGNCCFDYEDICLQPANIWTCDKLRCGEKRLPSSLCSCSDDCKDAKDCCVNYDAVCRGNKSWVEEKCETIQTPLCPAGFSQPPVILFSLDGFRAEYLQTWGGLLPVISKLKQCGTYTRSLRPVYPSKTFPNHYSIVTGLYPESHGLVDNKMYDPHRNALFTLRNAEKFHPSWYQGEPVWITAMKQGLKTASFFWPGSDVKLNGTYPNIYKEYNGSIPFETRIMSILKWLHLPEDVRPHFYTLYLEEPDSSGHRHSPVSSAVIKALMTVDRIVGMLMDGLKQMNLDKCVHLLLLSDHGMEESRCENIAYLSSYVNVSDDYIVVYGPAARLRPTRLPDEYFSFDYADIAKNLSCRQHDQHFKPFLKQHLPKRFHFARNDRIESLHFYSDPKWQVVKSPEEIKVCNGGFHGSDNLFKSMQALFIGYGPKFKHGVEVQPFENIEIYNLMCELLEVEPAPNNGTRGSLNHLLKQPLYEPSLPKELFEPFQCSVIHGARVNSLGCSCDSLTEAEYKKQLTLTPQRESDTKKLNLPYGRPLVLQNSSYCILYHIKYVSGFSYNIKMPLWSSYTLGKNELVPASVKNDSCLFVDVRIPQGQSQSCQYYYDHQSLTFGFLFPPGIFMKCAECQGLSASQSNAHKSMKTHLTNVEFQSHYICRGATLFRASSRSTGSVDKGFKRSSKDDDYSGLTTSNMLPMYPAFQGIWKYFHDVLLAKYAKKKNGINVISGPIFDYDFDGKSDSLEQIKKAVENSDVYIPTHYFIILTSCKTSFQSPDQCSSPLEVMSFVIPHREDYRESCAEHKELTWIEELLRFNVARVKDIELLTGLSFFHNTNFSVNEILQLKTFLSSNL